jgi:hypothetical protein
MTKVYIRSETDEGKRTWKAIGHLSPVTLEEDSFVLFLQVAPGKVYHARFDLDVLDGPTGDIWFPAFKGIPPQD